MGDKDGQPWRVGIQMPDTFFEQPMIAHPMTSNESMATSGDYRIYFEVDGKRYSHTIDPRTGRPITHNLASVTVVSDSCMKADAWATAINVLGREKGLELADAESLSCLLVSRVDDQHELSGTGSMAGYVKHTPTSDSQVTASVKPESAGIVPIAILSMILLGILVFVMAIGVMLGRKPIAGSCGGIASQTGEDGSTSCSLCSNPSDACKELRDKMSSKETAV